MEVAGQAAGQATVEVRTFRVVPEVPELNPVGLPQADHGSDFDF